jgi:hypothetical protein
MILLSGGAAMKMIDHADAEASPAYSPLCQRIVRDGTELDVQIYKDDKGGCDPKPKN